MTMMRSFLSFLPLGAALVGPIVACAERETSPPSTPAADTPKAPRYMPPIMPAYASSTATATATSGQPPAMTSSDPPRDGGAESSTSPDEVTVSPAGSVSDSEKITTFVRAHARECFRKALNIDPHIDGRLTVTVTLGDKGAVSAVKATPSGKLPDTLASCVEKKSMPAQFAAPSASPATVTIPIALSLKPKP